MHYFQDMFFVFVLYPKQQKCLSTFETNSEDAIYGTSFIYISFIIFIVFLMKLGLSNEIEILKKVSNRKDCTRQDRVL